MGNVTPHHASYDCAYGMNESASPKTTAKKPGIQAVFREWSGNLSALFKLLVDRASNLTRTNYELGCQLAERGNAGDAIYRFRVVTWLDPNHVMAWYNLGCCYYARKDMAKAVEALRKTLALQPNHDEALFMLALADPRAVPAGRMPVAMPLSLIVSHFDTQAARYTLQQLGQGYQGHVIAEAAVKQFLTERLRPGSDAPPCDVLDLGCGSGLVGQVLRPLVARLEGVDVSRAMHAVTSGLKDTLGKPIYDAVHRADFGRYFAEHPAAQFDVVCAINSVHFSGDLSALLGGIAAALKPQGMAVLLHEGLPAKEGVPEFQLVPGRGRFAHRESYLRAQAEAQGLVLQSSAAVEAYPNHTMQCSILRKA